MSRSGGGDDERQTLIPARCEDAGGDDDALARDDGEEPVDRGHGEYGEQAPRRAECAFDDGDHLVGHGASPTPRRRVPVLCWLRAIMRA
jgi:hypothetical protein